MGEVTKTRRTLIVPNQAIATYVTQWTYDSHNRLLEMIYPDEEKVTYSYNLGGQLEKVRGYKSYGYDYVNRIGYDKFEQRTYLKYCNGAETFYTYEPARRRLQNLTVNAGGKSIMDNGYAYDAVSNVLSVANKAALPESGKAGGQMAHAYTYDALYRLASATGTYAGADSKTASYRLEMGYDNMHRIVSKKQHLTQQGVQFDGTLHVGYDLAYTYGKTEGKKFQLAEVKDANYRTEENPDSVAKIDNNHTYTYDANGNLVYVNTGRIKQDGALDSTATERKLRWDEENRLTASDDNGFVTNYWYDADGERTVKTSGEGEQLYVNSEFAGGRTNTAKFSLYVSPYLVANQGGRYTKHIYIGSQRIVSKIGDFASYGSDPRRIQYAGSETDGLSVNYKQKYSAQQQVIKDNHTIFEVPYNGTDNNDYVDGQGFCCDDGSPEAAQARALALENNFQDPDAYEKLQFYYHPDHLGSSSYITNLDGEVVQHIEYVPFGEVFIEERNSIWNTPYLFNAKEFDEETGMYYYGARYYDPRLSLWISTDPMEEKMPNYSTYCYTVNNPVYYIDPSGQIPIAPIIWWAGKRVVAGAIVDISVQLLQEWIENGGSIEDSWNRLDINWIQVTSSAGENLIKGKYTAAALSAGIDMTTYIFQNGTWDGALMQAGFGALSSIVGDKLASIFARKVGDISITAKQIFSGGLENRKLAEGFAIAHKYKGYKNANVEIRNNNPIFDLYDDNSGNIVDVTTTNAKNLLSSTPNLYRKLRRLSSVGNCNKRILQIYVEKGRYSSQEIGDLRTKLHNYIRNNNLNVDVSIDQIK